MPAAATHVKASSAVVRETINKYIATLGPKQSRAREEAGYKDQKRLPFSREAHGTRPGLMVEGQRRREGLNHV